MTRTSVRAPAHVRSPTALLWHPVHFLSLGLGSGLSRWAPGTMGTLAGWFLWPLLVHQLPIEWLLAWLIACTGFGVWACGVTAHALGDNDPEAVVWDEIVALWWVLLFTPANWLAQGAAVALFRLFDITKPWPIRMVERRVKGGLGIMIDDLIAAVMTLFVLAVAVHYDVLPR